MAEYLIDLRHLRYFVAVAEELHFGRAAARLHIAQPPLSRQIRQLEEKIGVQLLRRTPRRVELTEAGRVFLEEARGSLARVAEAVRATRRAERGETGRLAIGFVGSATYSLLPALVPAFRRRYPEVDLVLEELTTTQQVEGIRTGRIQVGFLRPPVLARDVFLETVFEEPLIAALPERHRLARRSRIDLRSVADESFILPARHLSPSLYDRIIALCQRAGFSPRVEQEAIQMQTVVGLVGAGIGISVVPASLRRLRSLGAVFKALRGPPALVQIAMACRAEYAAPATRNFMGLARAAGLRSLPAALATRTVGQARTSTTTR